MGDVGIESTLVLDGLAVSKVRFYSTLDSDVGKRVEITDKFNPLNVFTGTFDESLNLLYDLPAFTSYQVKMYGLDGETVESDQSFMLKGYDYIEMNVGLNKNSFAGIKAIVDQGLENSMLEVGHTWYEDDGANAADVSVPWTIVAINYQPQTEGYNHSVMIGRGRVIDTHAVFTASEFASQDSTSKLAQYYNALPSRIKDTITTRGFYRKCYYTNRAYNPERWVTDANEYHYNAKVWIPDVQEVVNISNGGEYGRYGAFPYYEVQNNRRKLIYNAESASYIAWYLAGNKNVVLNYLGAAYTAYIQTTGAGGEDASPGTQRPLVPHMMIASDPIAQNS